MKSLFLLPLAVLAAQVQASATPFPITQGYGFDWLHPKTAKCRPVPATIAQLKSCEYRANAGFTGVEANYACRLDQRREWLIFKDLATCQEQLEIMEAHAP